MAYVGRLIALGVVALAGAGHAAGPCEEGRPQTGLAVALAPSGLAVVAVDSDSPAATSGLAVGDAVVQVNGALARTCGDYARAVRDARSDRKAVLLLVRRGGAEVVAALGAASWERVVAAAPPPPPPTEPPSVRKLVETPPPPPLPPETSVTLAEVTRNLTALAGADRPSAALLTYRRDVVQVERQVGTLAARASAPGPVLEGLRTVLRYYDAAGVAWASEEAERERERRPRHLPTLESATAPYFEGSDVAAVIDEFPFLREVVVRDPTPGPLVGESAGLWRPREARRLLWERGREELGRLTAWLAERAP